MRKRYLSIIGFILCFINSVNAQNVNFPYQNDLKGPAPLDVVGVPGRDQEFTPNGIQLTKAVGGTYGNGAVVFEGASFTSDQGLSIEFEYDMYDGKSLNGRHGDGIVFFLFDATAPIDNSLTGATAGAMSYTYDRQNSQGQVGQAGLDKAYLGIALDAYGNFRTRSNRSIGIYNMSMVNSGASAVTLRGAMRHTAIGADKTTTTSYISNNYLVYDNRRYQGYPVLITRSTIGGSGYQGQILDMVNNSATKVQYNNITTQLPKNFNIRGGELNPPVTSLNYRKAFITLGPADPAIGGGYYVTVDLYNGLDYIRVIDQFHYKVNFYYNENSNPGVFVSNFIYSIQATVPQYFKIGFGGSIGSATQTQLIKNLVVDLAYTPRFEPDYVMFCENVSEPTQAIVDVFANDFVYNGPIYGPPTQGNGPQNIDYSSFKFTDSEVVPYNELGTWTGNILTYNDVNQGIWSYDRTTGLVTFIPNVNFSGKATIYYTAKGTGSQGGPFNQDEYYSVPDEIVVEEIKCGGFINPQLPFKSETNFLNN